MSTPTAVATAAVFLGVVAYSADVGANCRRAGPQAPRDIMSKRGANTTHFVPTGPTTKMNLCNIHFHNAAEHRGPGFAKLAPAGKKRGYVCQRPAKSGPKSRVKFKKGCKDVKAGDTIEVHWVFTTCDVKPGPGLGSCVSKTCANPQLRVEASVFKVVDHAGALDFRKFDGGVKRGRYYQPKRLPPRRKTTTYLGSTTGPKYTDSKCSPYQVTWNVAHGCQLVDVNTVHAWCDANAFNESEAHGVRVLVRERSLVAPIR